MHIHILGIAGTFMAGLAYLARAKGYHVTGADENIYLPMSTQLADLGIEVYRYQQPLAQQPDKVIIGNALKRGNPAVEEVLNQGLPYQSGPQWLAQEVLSERWVIAVAGTHGKTTTSSMVAWILTYAGLEPGFLIGGVPANFGVSAQWGRAPFFVIEADEYDSAFFDKRSKFVHYSPLTCVINNIEFDHADIFQDLEEIKKQFHHLIRTIPGKGAVIAANDPQVQAVLNQGCWSEIRYFGGDSEWQACVQAVDGSVFDVTYRGKWQGRVHWSLIGEHNVHNGLAAIAAAAHAGVRPAIAIEALAQFQSVKRRLERIGELQGVTVYDDFAHHPTAIRTTVAGLRAKCPEKRIFAVLDISSNSMCMGTHQHQLASCLIKADWVLVYQSTKVAWDVANCFSPLKDRVHIYQDVQSIIDHLIAQVRGGDQILIMSNGSFDHLHSRLLQALKSTP